MYNTKSKGYQTPEVNILSFQSMDVIMNSLVDASDNIWSEDPWANGGAG